MADQTSAPAAAAAAAVAGHSSSSSSSPSPTDDTVNMTGAGAHYDYSNPPAAQQPASAEQQQSQMALPSIQHFDAQSQQQPPPPSHYGPPPIPSSSYHPSVMQQPLSHAPHPPPYPPVQYQYHTGAAPPPPTMHGVSSQNGMMRYPLQPQPSMESRQLSGSNKKEIKRRTKTGCITCRKRRIKCDEAQPTCRNCQKSKRECMGYDPVFKQAPQPAAIQPAPNLSPLLPQRPPSHHHQQPLSQQHSPLPPHSQHLQHSAPPSLQHPPPHPTPSVAYPPTPSYPATGGSFVPASTPQYSPETQAHPEYRPAPLDPALSTVSPQQNMAHTTYPPSLQPQRNVKPISVQDLFSFDGIPPRYREGESHLLTSSDYEAIDAFFRFHYASGLDRLFETTWYSQRGLNQIREDLELQAYVIQCMEQMSSKEESAGKAIMSLEARLIWLLATLPRNAASRDGASSDPQLQELLPRIDTVEYLLTGQFMDPSRVPPPAQASPSTGQPQNASSSNQKYNERSFWHHLARFVSIRDDQPSGLNDISDSLNSMRAILNMLETRDVLYSLAIGRHFGGRLPDFPQRHIMASSNDPNDEINKLKVAYQFTEQEEQRGLSQVYQRICSMALRSWMLQKQ